MKVVCIGSGYVGSVTGAALAMVGHETVIVDIDPAKVQLINTFQSPIFEPGMDAVFRHLSQDCSLSAACNYAAVHDADVVFIAVGTPSQADGTADLKYVKAAAASIGSHLNPGTFTVIVNKSTVPVGTSGLVASVIEDASGLLPDKHFAVVSNPEFLREGYALEDVFYPDRIVVGTSNQRAAAVMRELYEPIVARSGYETIERLLPWTENAAAPEPVYFETDAKSAEMIKYVSNAFLSIKISYVNEIARLCDNLGANVNAVAKGMGLDSRIGEKFLQVSSGWSGSCFPKDTAEILETSRKYGAELTLVKAAVDSNVKMHEYCIEKIKRRLTTLTGRNIGVLGLTFKPNTDDARHTQAAYMIRQLTALGASVAAHDPKGMDMFRRINNELPVRYCTHAEDVAERADCIILMTHWDEYGMLDWKSLRRRMRTPYVLDTRNILNAGNLLEAGLTYEGLGIAAGVLIKRRIRSVAGQDAAYLRREQEALRPINQMTRSDGGRAHDPQSVDRDPLL